MSPIQTAQRFVSEILSNPGFKPQGYPAFCMEYLLKNNLVTHDCKPVKGREKLLWDFIDNRDRDQIRLDSLYP